MSKVIYINLGSGQASEHGSKAYRNFCDWEKENPNAEILDWADFRKDYKNVKTKIVFMYYPYQYNRIRKQKHIFGKAIIR